jgi:hypothetical protein
MGKKNTVIVDFGRKVISMVRELKTPTIISMKELFTKTQSMEKAYKSFLTQ